MTHLLSVDLLIFFLWRCVVLFPGIRSSSRFARKRSALVTVVEQTLPLQSLTGLSTKRFFHYAFHGNLPYNLSARLTFPFHRKLSSLCVYMYSRWCLQFYYSKDRDFNCVSNRQTFAHICTHLFSCLCRADDKSNGKSMSISATSVPSRG